MSSVNFRNPEFDDFFAALASPIPASEVKQRPAGGGQSLDYITARTAMNRLDSVVGPGSWESEFVPLPRGIMCRLTVTLPDGSKVTKCEVGGYVEGGRGGLSIEDADKSGPSDAFKRACAAFGIARELYQDGVAEFVESPPSRSRPGASSPAPQRQSGGNGVRENDPTQPPDKGGPLYYWCQDIGQRYQLDLVRVVGDFAKANDLPVRNWRDWPQEALTDVGAVLVETIRSAVSERDGDCPW